MKKTQEELQAIVFAQEAEKTFRAEALEIVSGYSMEEINSWPEQLSEAKSYTADPTAETPLIDAMISENGETKDAMVLRIIEKANAFSASIGAALGRKQKRVGLS